MLPNFINYVNPVTDERFVATLRPFDGFKLIKKYYPQLHFMHLSIPDSNDLAPAIDFVLQRFGVDILRVGLDALSSITKKSYQETCDPQKVSKYIIDAILSLSSNITDEKLPNWNYIQRACAINVYQIFFDAIAHKTPFFFYHVKLNNSFGASFVIYYNNRGNKHLSGNDFGIIDKLLNATRTGTIVEIMTIKQEQTNYRKTLEKLFFEGQLKFGSHDIFFDFDLRDYMFTKYHAVKYGEL